MGNIALNTAYVERTKLKKNVKTRFFSNQYTFCQRKYN